MILAATQAQAARSRRLVEVPGLFNYHKAEWLHTEPAQGAPSPLIYLVEQPPRSVLPSHFHRQNQFQVFVSGGGSFGARIIRPGMVHYANAYTGYGPITAGDDGLRYFTLRAVYDTGAYMVATDRAAMQRGPRRNLHADCGAALDAASLAVLSGTRRMALFPVQVDALEAERISAPPHARVTLPAPEGLGSFCHVLQGSISHGDMTLARHESLYLSPGEAASWLTAGPGGADVLRLQMPQLAPEYSLNA